MGRSVTLALTVAGLATLSQIADAQGSCPPQPLEILPPSQTYEVTGIGGLLDGDRLAVSLVKPPLANPVAMAVYQRDLGGPGAWGLQHTVLPPILGGKLTAAALDQDTLVAKENVTSGGQQDGVYVYQLNPGINDWTLMKTLPMSAGAIGLQGDTMTVSVGLSTQVLERHLGGVNQWGLDSTLLAPSPTAFGFGTSLSFSGDLLAVGDALDYTPASFSGAVTVYERSGGTWTTAKLLYQPNGIAGQFFGTSVAIEGDLLLVGATGAKVAGVESGVVFVFSRDEGGPDNWGLLTKIKPTDPTEDALFGVSISLSGDLALIGETRYSKPGCPRVGRAYLVQRDRGGIDSWGLVTAFDYPGACATTVAYGQVVLDGSSAVIGTSDISVSAAYVYDDLLSSCPMMYCTSGTSANGCRAFLDVDGAPSASAPSGFDLGASGVEGGVSGMLFFGSGGRQASPWGNGTSFQCVVPPVQRGGLLTGTGTPGACDGTFNQDLNALWCASCPKPAKNPGAGAVVQAQLWYRDPQNTSNQTTSLSDAVEFTVGP